MNSLESKSTISVTDAAFAQARTFWDTQPEFKGLPLRIYISGKECSGFLYGVTFDGKTSDDVVCASSSDIELICDQKTLGFVKGSTVDWADDERGRGFVVENPSDRKFRGKFYQRPDWEKKVYGDTPAENVNGN